ncbi:MAG TPA: type IV secretory system conjugative DNA transfer family protein [Acidimicrobiales bacterium]
MGSAGAARGQDVHAEVLHEMGVHGNRIYLGAGARGWTLAARGSGVLVLGPPRSGKTTAIVIPAILAANGAVVSTSTKLDVLSATAPARRRLGTCWVFDPSGQIEVPAGLTPLHWSPVEGSRRWDGALVIARGMLRATRPAEGIADASHWAERAETLLAPLLHAAALGGEGMEFVFRAVHRAELDDAKKILVANDAGIALDVLEQIATTEARERSSIRSTAAGALAAYRFPAALAQASSPNFDPALFPSSVDTIYVCAPARQQALIAPIVVGLVEEIRSATYARDTLDPPVLLALDEVANVAPLPDLAAIVSEGASQGLLTLACLQDLSQARTRWGQAADGFMSLFGTKVVLPGIGDLRTLELVSALAGEAEVAVRSVSKSPWRPRTRVPRSSVTTSTRRQRRLPVDSIAQGRVGHALLIDGPKAPGWMRLTPWYATPPWSEIAGPRQK